MSKKPSKLKVIFMGGIGEIGKNMTLIEYEKSIIVIDAGMSFPSDQMPGIDYVIPDYNYLTQNKEKVKGIAITHGHEDHIGALPFLLKDIDVPVYGSSLSLALINHKLEEAKVSSKNLKVVTDKEIVEIGCFKVEFIKVTHSITGAFSLSITTPKGVIFFTGDFKIDHTPIDDKATDLNRIAAIGSAGVLLLMMDSTNVERNGFSMSERNVYKNLDNLFNQNLNKRIIVATFASNIHRVQQILNCAEKYNRKVAFSGRSMINIAEIAYGLGELKYNREMIVDIEKIGKIPYDKLCIISTGTQGEPMSALTRMSQNDFKKVIINENDTVILSAAPIPGNEKMVYNVINNLYKMGAEVIYQALSEVHASGHACKEELKMMFSLIRPKYFIPIHGEYRHLKQHTLLAKEMGIPEANIMIPELGSCIEVNKDGLKRMEPVNAGSILVDGSGLAEDTDVLLRDRRHLAADGFIIIIITTHTPELNPPIIIARGLNIPEKLSEEMRDNIGAEMAKDKPEGYDVQIFKQIIRKMTGKAIMREMKKKPMIIPIVIEN